MSKECLGSGESDQLVSPVPIILATGFNAKQGLLAQLLDFDSEGVPGLTKDDESQKTPGFFLVGPQVVHKLTKPEKGWPEGTREDEADKETRKAIFCFIYKYRTRWAHIVHKVADRLCEARQVLVRARLADPEPPFDIEKGQKVLQEYQKHGMKMSDVSGAQCACGC